MMVDLQGFRALAPSGEESVRRGRRVRRGLHSARLLSIHERSSASKKTAEGRRAPRLCMDFLCPGALSMRVDAKRGFVVS
jgi:hypothetical protein